MKLIIFLLIFSLQISPQDISDFESEPTSQVIISDIILIAPAAVSFIMIHELGHYTMGKIFGAENARFGLYRKKPDGFSIGWISIDGGLNSFGRSMFNIGGVLGSRGFAELSDLTVKSDVLYPFFNKFFSMTFLLGRFDLPRYVLQDALMNLFDHKGSDIHHFVTEIAGDKTGWRTITYLLLLGGSVLDLVLDWDRVSKHWGVVTGNPYSTSEDISNLDINLFSNNFSTGLSITIKF